MSPKQYIILLIFISVMPYAHTADQQSFCSASIIPDIPLSINNTIDDEDIQISAEEAEVSKDGTSIFQGNVIVKRGADSISADTALYDPLNQSVHLEHNVSYHSPQIYVEGDSATLQLDNRTGQYTDVNYVLINRHHQGYQPEYAQGHAQLVSLDSGNTTLLNHASFSSCEQGNEFWQLNARQIKLDHQKEWGSAKHVVAKIKQVPLLYLPYISFPISDKRKTGLLPLSYGSSQRNGAELNIPYYWNILPNMDATITPRLMSKRGVMGSLEYRYLLPTASGTFNGDYLADDDQTGSKRYLWGLVHNQTFLQQGHLDINYQRASDQDYFSDFGYEFNTTSTRFLSQHVEVGYTHERWQLLTRIEDYQIIDDNINNNLYKRLPQLSGYYHSPSKNRRVNYGMNADLNYFDAINQTNNPQANMDGSRFNIEPFLSYPIHTTASYIEPRIALHYTYYDIDGVNGNKQNLDRLMPIFSLNSGLFFDRQTRLFGQSYQQTLEPQLFYLYIPSDEKDEAMLPLFDTSLYDFSYAALFRHNRFNGLDRLGDANQITTAIRSQWINTTTDEMIAQFAIGQIHYLDKPAVTLNNVAPYDNHSSPLIMAFSAQAKKHWYMEGELQWDTDQGREEKIVTRLQYRLDDQQSLSIGYRLNRQNFYQNQRQFPIDIKQTEVAFNMTLKKKWQLTGRWYYTLTERQTLEAFTGLAYESCCWRIQAVLRRFLVDNNEFDNGFLLQLTLKGLGNIGQKTKPIFNHSVNNYGF